MYVSYLLLVFSRSEAGAVDILYALVIASVFTNKDKKMLRLCITEEETC
jgi:hypothetical protein